MPERWTTNLTEATLKFAAGDDAARSQFSSTWYVRVTRGGEIFVLNYQAGGDRAHVSFHQDGRCHYKLQGPGGGKLKKQSEWMIPEPMDEEGLRRLITIVIPSRGMVIPQNFAAVDPETVLIPPAPVGEQLNIDVFIEPGVVPAREWPGQSAMGSLLIGRFTAYVGDGEPGWNVTVVSTVDVESEAVRHVGEGHVRPAPGTPPLPSPRMLIFELAVVDGQQLPVITEMSAGLGR